MRVLSISALWGRERISGAQRLGVVPPLVRVHRTPVAAQLGVLLLELAALAPLPPQLAGVLGVAVVGPPPGLRHHLGRTAGARLAAERYPGRDLVADPPEGRAGLLGAVGDGGHLLEQVPLRAAVVVEGHRLTSSRWSARRSPRCPPRRPGAGRWPAGAAASSCRAPGRGCPPRCSRRRRSRSGSRCRASGR